MKIAKIIFFAFLFPLLTNADPCKGLRSSSDFEVILAKLRDLGYSEAVLDRLSSEKPEWLKELASHDNEKLKPTIFYRGIGAPPRLYQPDYKITVRAGPTWVSSTYVMPLFKGIQSGDKTWPGGMILEYQIPKAFFPKNEKENFALPDLSLGFPIERNPEIFITRFGVIDYPGSEKAKAAARKNGTYEKTDWFKYIFENLITWYPYTTVVQDLEKFRSQFTGVQPGATP